MAKYTNKQMVFGEFMRLDLTIEDKMKALEYAEERNLTIEDKMKALEYAAEQNKLEETN